MRVGIDARALTQHPTSGVAMFTREIIDALRCVSDDELILFTKTDIARPFRRLPIIGNHFAFARAVDKAKVDVFFLPPVYCHLDSKLRRWRLCTISSS